MNKKGLYFISQNPYYFFTATLLHKKTFFFNFFIRVNTMKNKFAALIAATFVATSASAGGFENQVFANENVKAMELSQTEMKETQGEWGSWGAFGALFMGNVAAYTHHYQVRKETGQYASPQSTATAAGLGIMGTAMNLSGKAPLLNKAGVTTFGVAAQHKNTQAEINRIKAERR